MMFQGCVTDSLCLLTSCKALTRWEWLAPNQTT